MQIKFPDQNTDTWFKKSAPGTQNCKIEKKKKIIILNPIFICLNAKCYFFVMQLFLVCIRKRPQIDF